jgi:hypothetical protein
MIYFARNDPAGTRANRDMVKLKGGRISKSMAVSLRQGWFRHHNPTSKNRYAILAKIHPTRQLSGSKLG